MIQLCQKMLKQLQKIELEMLLEVNRICQKCNIQYHIIAGTMLGAVRHKGFIPWDDDADVAMLRSEYDRFCEACVTELDTSRFYFQDQDNTEGYRWGYGKLRRKDTLFLRENQEHMPYEQGVFIDIFPMDSIPQNYFLRSIHNIQCFCYRKLFWAEVGKRADKSTVMRAVYQLLSQIPLEKLKKSYRKFIDKSNKNNSEFVRMLLFPLPNKVYGYYRQWYLESEFYQFEGKELVGFAQYDEYLTFCYGKYMELPPVEKQKVHPVSNISLIDVILD